MNGEEVIFLGVVFGDDEKNDVIDCCFFVGVRFARRREEGFILHASN